MTDEDRSAELPELINDASITLQVPEAALLQALGEASLHDEQAAQEAAEILKRHIAQIRQIGDELSAWLYPNGPRAEVHQLPERPESE